MYDIQIIYYIMHCQRHHLFIYCTVTDLFRAVFMKCSIRYLIQILKTSIAFIFFPFSSSISVSLFKCCNKVNTVEHTTMNWFEWLKLLVLV